MTHTLKSLALGALLVAGAGTAATAADWNNGDGSLKDYSNAAAAVPVPAPQPLPVYRSAWYFRLDGAFGFAGTKSASESGGLYGLNDSPGVSGPTPFGTSPSWFTGPSGSSESIGVGAGWRWADQWRSDITGEWRSPAKASIAGNYQYNQYQYVTNPATGAATYVQRVSQFTTPSGAVINYPYGVNGTVNDNIEQQNAAFLLNTYYDFRPWGDLTPYVGAGVGFSYQTNMRNYAGTEYSCAPGIDPQCTSTRTTRSTGSLTGTAHTIVLAAQASAGISYAISDATLIDVGYRFLYTQGSSVNVILDPATVNVSRVTFGDQFEHQLRAGIRFNIE